MKKIILLAILFISSTGLWAQTGYLDTTFNSKGPLKGVNAVISGTEGKAIAVDSKGRVVVAATLQGSNIIKVFRLKTDGTLDKPFGLKASDTVANILLSNYFGTGYPGSCSSIAIQKDGKILIGGTLSPKKDSMMVIRLNANGSMDSTFNKDGMLSMDLNLTGADEVRDLAVQSNGKIIVSGTSQGKAVILCLNQDGSKNTGFTSYTSSGNLLTETASGLEIINDTIIASGSYANATTTPVANSYYAIKLSPNGVFVWRKDINFSSSSVASVGDVAMQPNGKIIIAGSDYNGFRAYRLLPDGNIDLFFNGSGTFLASFGNFPAMKSIVIEKDGKIVLTGNNGNYLILRTDSSGFLDKTFGSLGTLTINTGKSGLSGTKSVLSPDQKLLIAGDIYSTTSYAEVLKVELKPVVHIIGDGYAQPGGVEKYTIQIPPSWGAVTYQWSYSGLYFDYIPGTTGYPIKILFSDTATSGKLICKITSAATGVILGAGEIDIVINPKPSNANQLATIDCQTSLAKCAMGYIDYFTLNTLNNSGSGCSPNGYTDYTQSNFTDTLVAGGVYAATLKIPNDGTFTNYVGIWIDYNNDGNFSNIDEFVGEGFSNESKIKVDIFLKNREGYDGPKRIRVRSRPDVKITSTESCPANGEEGEIEDYLVVLSKQPTLEAPQIITPNEDGLNDYFVIRGADPNKENKLTIFDRIGAVKYSSANYENDWNGVGKDGNKLSPGTYYYVVSTGKTSIKGFLEIRY